MQQMDTPGTHQWNEPLRSRDGLHLRRAFLRPQQALWRPFQAIRRRGQASERRSQASERPTQAIRRGLSLILVLLLTLATLPGLTAGCASQSTQPVPSTQKGEIHPLIGLAMDTLVIERWGIDRNVIVSTINELGGRVIVQNANSDSSEQKNQIRYLISKGVDVLVVVAIDPDQLKDILLSAQNLGIDVIAYDRMISNATVDLFVSFDSIEIGRLMAQAVVTAAPRGRYAIMNGAATDNNSALIRSGIREVLEQHPECRIVAEAVAENWSADDAYGKFKGIIASYPGLDGIICANDALAGAAVRALALSRRSGQVAVTGQDADIDACQRIAEGLQTMTVYKPIRDLAKRTASAAMALARGEPVDTSDSIQVEGRQIPYIRIRPVAVTRANLMDVIVNSGFHSAKDVYRNVPTP